MHEEAITTTSTTSKFSNATVINSTSLHQSHHLHDDGTITVSIIHPHHQQQHADLGDFNLDEPCSSITNQIVPSQTKIIVSSNDLHALNKDDVSSVIINGSLSNNPHDPTVLILPASETCDSDKNSLNLSQLTSSHVEHVEIDVQDVSSLNDETSSREGESNDPFHSLPSFLQ